MTSILWGNSRPFLDGDKVRELLDKKGWPIIKLSMMSGVPDSVISKALHYKTKPRDETVEWLADTLGVTPNEIRIEAKDATDKQKQAYEQFRKQRSKKHEQL